MASVVGKGNRTAAHGRKRALERGIWEGDERWKGVGKCVNAWCTKGIEFGEDPIWYVKGMR